MSEAEWVPRPGGIEHGYLKVALAERSRKKWPRVAYPTIPWVDLFLLEECLVGQKVALTGVNIKWDGEGYFVILKGVRKGVKVVNFTGGQTWADALETLGWEVSHRVLDWRPDKY